MVMTGKRKFICDECGDATFFSARERQKKSRPQCRWCGSYSIFPAPKSLVKEEILQEGENLLLDKEFSTRIIKCGKGHKKL